MTFADSPYDASMTSPGDRRADGHGDRRQTYRAARRHSLLVRFLRLVLPVSAFAALAGLALMSWISAPLPLDFSVARTSISGNGIVMERPTLTGFDNDNRSYRVTADRAIQNIATPNEVRLNDIRAEIALPDDGSATVTAAGGDYDNKSGTLKLIGPIKVDSTMGYQVSLKNADIDLQSGILVSRNPVTIRYQDSEITGDTMTVSDGGKVIVLEGRVESRLMPPKREAGDAGADGVKDGSGKAAKKDEAAAAPAPQSIGDMIESAQQ